MQQETKNYYEILGLTHEASAEDIRRNFLRLAKQYHPDHNNNEDSGKMATLNQVYEVLSDPVKKREYDKRFIPVQVHDFTKPKVEIKQPPESKPPEVIPQRRNWASRPLGRRFEIPFIIFVVCVIIYLLLNIAAMYIELPGTLDVLLLK